MIRYIPVWICGLLTTFALASPGSSQEPLPMTNTDPALQNPIEVQTRGPVHEAFAHPFDGNARPGDIVPKQPPTPILEEPPEQKPDAANAQWIPGYWSWDSERQDFIWISGTYRVPPQGRTYVPGYFSQTDEGWRWVSGYWSGQNQDSPPLTPAPPETLDNGPAQQAPNDNSTYIPGSWAYSNSRFAWRPGYWSAVQAGWVWVPAHYVWTPNGYLFVDGYWDYPMDARGMIFAPVYFRRALWANAGWQYQPDFVVDLAALFDSCFIRAGGFYFGNYYGNTYAGLGFRPWFSGMGRYDPAFSYYGWQHHRGNGNWVGGVQQTYAGRASGRLAAPPRTLAQQQTGGAAPVVIALNRTSASGSLRLVRTSAAQLQAERAGAQRIRDLAAQRRSNEASRAAARTTIPATTTGTVHVNPARVVAPANPATHIHQAAPARTTIPANSGTVHVNPARVVTPVNPATHIQQAAPAHPRQTSPAPSNPAVRTNQVAPTIPHVAPRQSQPMPRHTPAAPQARTVTPHAPAVTTHAAPARTHAAPPRPAPHVSAPARTTTHAAPQRPAPQRPAPQRPAPQRPAPQRPAPQQQRHR